MATFRLYPEAELDLESVWEYTAKTWGDNQAIKYIDDIETAFLLLVENPFLCRERTEFQPPVRIHHFQSHLIVYKQLGDDIGIIRILHESVDIEGHLE
ncbi:MAG: type II toxin-antitoxin system RelE/ParE family toxin [Gammaproteobacteria bacterium]|nr:type II toxin-antitoxin system RelE/ParE family toxin [Gammaproteobacteria bacterium]MBQ0841227.1 type II toxin-antitoxin system RelE/ParE family toxin [Gammaproteobacteria bacterium]